MDRAAALRRAERARARLGWRGEAEGETGDEERPLRLVSLKRA
jgi:hypothetical protein